MTLTIEKNRGLMKNEERLVIEQIANDDHGILDKLYKEYRNSFFAYFKRYPVQEDELKDLYQDTMIAFYQNVVRGKIRNLNSTIKTYIFGIGKYKVIDLMQKKSREFSPKEKRDEYEEIQVFEPSLTIHQKKLYKHFSQLGDSCKKMIKMFYYRGLEINEIVELGGYKDANTVKSHKSRCLKQLRTMINKENG